MPTRSVPTGTGLQVAENTGRTVNYTYDAVNRLTQEQITDAALGNQTISYTYDGFGNRLTKTDGTGTTNYTYNANDQLLTETAPGYTATYEYDANGNTVKKTQGATETTYIIRLRKQTHCLADGCIECSIRV